MKYPLGIQTFESLRKDGYVYVDKTELIYQLTHRGKYFFLSRPRRFGKSLLLSTIEAYFQGKRHLFEGLAIEHLEKVWAVHPVIHIDLNIGAFTDVKGLKEHLDYILTGLEKRHNIDTVNLRPSLRLDRIISHLAEGSENKVVVLIDEYDKPLLEAIGDTSLQEAMRDELRTFYSVLKSQERNIRFALLTGVTKFGRTNVFSGLNNITDISFYSDFASICGITKEEIFSIFESPLHQMADIYKLSKGEMYETLKTMYDGYRFTDANIKVFNPYSLLSAFDRKKIGPYWFETGTPKYLVQLLQMHHYNLWRLEGVSADESQLSKFDSDSNNPIPVIYQSGYLTIKDYNLHRNRYTLGFPNEEVRKGFMEYLLPFYAKTRDHTAFDIDSFVDDIESGNAQAFMNRLKPKITSYLH